MTKNYVVRDNLIGEIVGTYPESIEVLLSMGMHCLGCPASQSETLEQACQVHGVDVEEILQKINEKVAEKRGE